VLLNILLITVGMAIGLAIVLCAPVRKLLTAVMDLLVALRPLTIPVLVLLAAATVNLSPLAQGAAALALPVAVWLLTVRTEPRRSTDTLDAWWHAVENGVANGALKALLVAIPLTAIATIVTLAAPGDGLFAGQGGAPAVILLVALVAWAGALAARLWAYATSPWRALVALLMGAAVILGLVWAGVLWGGERAGSLTPLVAIAAAAALALASLAERGTRPQQTAAAKRATDQFYGAGLSLALFAGVALVVATTWSLVAIHWPDETPLGADAGAVGTIYTAHIDTPQYRYAPVLAFTLDQPWSPQSVDAYVNRGTVLRKDGTTATPGHYTCPSVGPPACLRRSCPRETCGQTLLPHHRGDHVSDGAVYVRTINRPDPHDRTDRAVALRGIFRPVTKIAELTQTLIQYWFFYPYDNWTAKVLGAQISQHHEGDWEDVTVGLGYANKRGVGAPDKPLFVAYSAHCGGSWKLWSKTQRFHHTHPLVAVANGSQGNYPDATATRAPDWTSCADLPRGIGALLSYAANARDRTSDDWQWGAETLISADETKAPMSFPGTWGDDDRTEIENERNFPGSPGGGPQSPPLQPLWRDPVRTIFCDTYWDGPEDCS
jgi:hypothetical protein